MATTSKLFCLGLEVTSLVQQRLARVWSKKKHIQAVKAFHKCFSLFGKEDEDTLSRCLNWGRTTRAFVFFFRSSVTFIYFSCYPLSDHQFSLFDWMMASSTLFFGVFLAVICTVDVQGNPVPSYEVQKCGKKGMWSSRYNNPTLYFYCYSLLIYFSLDTLKNERDIYSRI